MFVVCCLWSVVCAALFVVCCLLCVDWLNAACCVLRVVCWLLLVVCSFLVVGRCSLFAVRL